MEWYKLLATSGIGAGVLLCIQILVKGYLDRRKTSAEAILTEVNGEIQLSRAALEFIQAVRVDAERQIAAARTDAQAQISAARATAAEGVAQSLHEVATARAEVSQLRTEATSMRNTVERIEQLLLRTRAAIWVPGQEDNRVARVRELLGDGSTPLSALVNGAR